MAKRKHNPCRCVGPTLRFTRGECFTCGRMLGQFIGRLETNPRANGASAGFGALLHAVGRKRDALERRRERDRELRALMERPPRPRPKKVRRVAIDLGPVEPPPQRKHARKARSKAVRDVEFATRTF